MNGPAPAAMSPPSTPLGSTSARARAGSPLADPHSAAAFAAAVALLVFLPAISNGFAYDDVPLIQNDARVHGFGSIGAILGSGYWGDGGLGLYRPLTTLSFAIDWTISGGSAAWFHFTNAVLHAIATGLAVLLLARFFAPAAALLGGLLFAAHPVHVEAVANIVGRGDVLATIFALAGCLLWVGQRPADAGLRRRGGQGGRSGTASDARNAASDARNGGATDARSAAMDARSAATDARSAAMEVRAETRTDGRTPAHRVGRVLGIAICYALALASKESAVVLPVLLLLLDGARGRVSRGVLRAYVRESRWSFAALGSILAAFAIARASTIGLMPPSNLDPSLEAVGGAARFWTALQAWPHYMRLLLAPVTLLADYGPGVIRSVQGPAPVAIAGLLLLGACGAAGALAFSLGRARLGVAPLWFVAAMLPVSSLIVPIGVLVAERTLYLPSVAVAWAGAAGFAWALARGGRGRRVAVTAAALLACAGAIRCWQRVPDWDSTDAVMIAQLRDRPDSFRAHWHLARVERQRGDTAAALERYARAIEIWPHRRRLIFEAAAFAVAGGRLPHAHELAAFASRRWPDDIDAQRMLAGTALDMGDSATARTAVQAGLTLAPGDDILRRMLAALSTTRNGPDE